MDTEIYEDWNPWHGCTKISEGCRNCYVYRQDSKYGSDIESNICRKTKNFNLPIKKNRKGEYKISSGKIIFTCFTSDFLLKDADKWREECWKMMKIRKDCYFYFFTKRIERLEECLPKDWENGYENVIIGCTVENQDRADFRLPIFLSLPIKHKTIIIAPMLEKINISKYLNNAIEEVSVGGESGINVRKCDYDWVLDIRKQCVEKEIPFRFHQTGAYFVKDGKEYRVKRKYQKSQANQANIDFGISKKYFIPENVQLEIEEKHNLQENEQITIESILKVDIREEL